ncbi:hypothetical protein TELCIR_07014 [Teladorsagia circumcincta]|uniref:Uncharacterized protein n=1 Tax=Teladorsagia circumcincta TaxID=45464 RepID=A0A2G9ULG0_TELCI|nr:hypothetical protein TELCIR_07014 [Teladorsagia circumcincta]
MKWYYPDINLYGVPATGKFARSFSIINKKKPVDEDVAQLVEACRRYQDEKISATATNLLLEEQEDEVGTMLADSIGNSVRTVLSTVTGGVRPATAKPPPPKRHTLSPSFVEVVVRPPPSSSPPPQPPLVPKPPRSRARDRKTPTIEEDGFEEVRSNFQTSIFLNFVVDPYFQRALTEVRKRASAAPCGFLSCLVDIVYRKYCNHIAVCRAFFETVGPSENCDDIFGTLCLIAQNNPTDAWRATAEKSFQH